MADTMRLYTSWFRCAGFRWDARLCSSFMKVSGEGVISYKSVDLRRALAVSSYSNCGAEGQDRTVDTRFFRPVLYQLSYLGDPRRSVAARHARPMARLVHRSARTIEAWLGSSTFACAGSHQPTAIDCRTASPSSSPAGNGVTSSPGWPTPGRPTCSPSSSSSRPSLPTSRDDPQGTDLSAAGFIRVAGDETDALALVFVLRDLSERFSCRIGIRDPDNPIAKLRTVDLVNGRLTDRRALESILVRRPIFKRMRDGEPDRDVPAARARQRLRHHRGRRRRAPGLELPRPRDARFAPELPRSRGGGDADVARAALPRVRAVVQRVSRAKVDGRVRRRSASSRSGLCVLLSVGPDDDEAVAQRFAGRIATLRIFPDAEGRMNLDLAASGGVRPRGEPVHAPRRHVARPPPVVHPGGIARPGRCSSTRPSWQRSAQLGHHVETGSFGAHMAVDARQRRSGDPGPDQRRARLARRRRLARISPRAVPAAPPAARPRHRHRSSGAAREACRRSPPASGIEERAGAARPPRCPGRAGARRNRAAPGFAAGRSARCPRDRRGGRHGGGAGRPR